MCNPCVPKEVRKYIVSAKYLAGTMSSTQSRISNVTFRESNIRLKKVGMEINDNRVSSESRSYSISHFIPGPDTLFEFFQVGPSEGDPKADFGLKNFILVTGCSKTKSILNGY